MRTWLRVWTEKDMSEIEKRLLIPGDAMGDRAQSKELGLEYRTAKQGPNCHTTFACVTSRRFESHPGERFQIVKRLSDVRTDLECLDYGDYKKRTGRQKARDFFAP